MIQTLELEADHLLGRGTLVNCPSCSSPLKVSVPSLGEAVATAGLVPLDEDMLPAQAGPVRLIPKLSMREEAVYVALNARFGNWVTWWTLRDLIWSGVATPATVTVTIRRLRKKLLLAGLAIEGQNHRGYRLIARRAS